MHNNFEIHVLEMNATSAIPTPTTKDRAAKLRFLKICGFFDIKKKSDLMNACSVVCIFLDSSSENTFTCNM